MQHYQVFRPWRRPPPPLCATGRSKRSGAIWALNAYFTPHDPKRRLEKHDIDLGSGGALLIPGTNYVVGGGMAGIFYLLERKDLTGVQEFPAFAKVYNVSLRVPWSWVRDPQLWRGPRAEFAYVYHWPNTDYLKAYRFEWHKGRFDADHPIRAKTEGRMSAGQIALSANENQAGTGVLWAIICSSDVRDPEFGARAGKLLAFDAETLELLWSDDIRTIPKWMPPTIAGGRVFVATSSKEILVYELGRSRNRDQTKR